MIEIKLQKTLQSGQGKTVLYLDFKIEKGSFITLYGPSGSGKTSTLRLLSGLLTPDYGSITVFGKKWFSSENKINLKPQKRSVGYVFQDYSLFPNMTVLENLEFALKKGQNTRIIEELISVIELEEFRYSKPHLLSGGQQQRVALARALVQQPDILLLDEPLSALDPKIRNKLQDYILTIHKKYGLTTILVSHDKEEILKLSDVVYEINDGKIINQEVSTSFFKETITCLEGTLTAKTKSLCTVKIGENVLEIYSEEESLSVGDTVKVTLYPTKSLSKAE